MLKTLLKKDSLSEVTTRAPLLDGANAEVVDATQATMKATEVFMVGEMILFLDYEKGFTIYRHLLWIDNCNTQYYSARRLLFSYR